MVQVVLAYLAFKEYRDFESLQIKSHRN